MVVRRTPSLGPAVALSGCPRVLQLQFLHMNCVLLFMLAEFLVYYIYTSCLFVLTGGCRLPHVEKTEETSV
jgi:hypothetical protein